MTLKSSKKSSKTEPKKPTKKQVAKEERYVYKHSKDPYGLNEVIEEVSKAKQKPKAKKKPAKKPAKAIEPSSEDLELAKLWYDTFKVLIDGKGLDPFEMVMSGLGALAAFSRHIGCPDSAEFSQAAKECFDEIVATYNEMVTSGEIKGD